MKDDHPLIKVADLSIRFVQDQGQLEAVKGISFCIQRGETLAVVGESGSGKSVSALSLARLLPPPPECQISGSIQLNGREISALSSKEIRALRGKEIAYVFQEPSSSLNPVFTIRSQIAEAIRLHRPEIRDVDEEIIRLLELVKIPGAAKRLNDYPHQLSGGMQQRVMIAMALSCQPALLIADEPTTALDVTIQAEIMNLMKDLKEQMDMSILMITHNFGIVSGFADRVIVMFRGKIVEEGSTHDVIHNPRHSYTRALIDCIPKLGKKQERLTTIDHSKLVQK